MEKKHDTINDAISDAMQDDYSDLDWSKAEVGKFYEPGVTIMMRPFAGSV